MSQDSPKSLDLRQYQGEENETVRAEEIAARREYLLQLGITAETVAQIESTRPALYSVFTVNEKIAGLEERGFSDPVKMITSLPAVLGYGFENIDAKIAGLKERGFADPVKMITSLPAVLSLSFGNIDQRIIMIKRIKSKYRWQENPIELMESIMFLWSSKMDKLWTIARILVGKSGNPAQADKTAVAKTLAFKLEALVLADAETADLPSLFAKAKTLNKLPKAELKKRVVALPESKVKQCYLQGYPINT